MEREAARGRDVARRKAVEDGESRSRCEGVDVMETQHTHMKSATAAMTAGIARRRHYDGAGQEEGDARCNEPPLLCSRDLCQETLPCSEAGLKTGDTIE